MTEYSVFEKRFSDYAGTFRLPDGTLSEPMQRKYDHTFDVVALSERISKAEGAGEEEFLLCRLAALFHDVARFRQVALHHTFNDTESAFDHGHEGAKILLEKDLLSSLAPDQSCAVLTAVELHNKPRVDFSRLGGIFSAPVRNVRDADKLSILGLLTAYIAGELKFRDPSVFLLKCQDSLEISPKILEAVLSGGPVLYRDLKTVNDFKVSLFSWSQDLNYPESARILLERNCYEKIRASLPDMPETDMIFRRTMEHLKCLSSK